MHAIGRLNTNNTFYDYCIFKYFNEDENIVVVGKLYNRKDDGGYELPDIYLCLKHKHSEEDESHACVTLGNRTARYESYNGKTLKSYSDEEAKYYWLTTKEMILFFKKSSIASINLERWDK